MAPGIGAFGAADMKGPRIPARGNLPEHAAFQPEKGFDDEMHHVVRQVGIETRRGIHHQGRRRRAIDPHRVTPLARPNEMNPHRIIGGVRAQP